MTNEELLIWTIEKTEQLKIYNEKYYLNPSNYPEYQTFYWLGQSTLLLELSHKLLSSLENKQ